MPADKPLFRLPTTRYRRARFPGIEWKHHRSGWFAKDDVYEAAELVTLDKLPDGAVLGEPDANGLRFVLLPGWGESAAVDEVRDAR